MSNTDVLFSDLMELCKNHNICIFHSDEGIIISRYVDLEKHGGYLSVRQGSPIITFWEITPESVGETKIDNEW